MVKKQRTEETGVLGGIIGGTLSLTVSTFVVKVLGLVYKIPLSHFLGDEGMGYFNSAYTVFGLFYLLCTAGVPKAVMILCSEARAKEDICTEKLTVKMAMKIFTTLGVVFTAVFAVFSFSIARLIGNSDSAFTMLSIAPSIVFVAIGGVLRGYLSSRSRYLDIAVAGVIEGVAKLSLGLIFAHIAIKCSMPLRIVSSLTILGTTIGAVLSCGYLYVCSKNKNAGEKTGQNGVFAEKQNIAKRIFKISVPITLSSAVMSLTNIIDLSLIMRRLTDAGYSEAKASALYGNYTTLAVSMLNFALSIITPLSIIFLPEFTRALVVRDYTAYSTAFDTSVKTVSFIAAPLTFGFMFYSSEILTLIFGEESSFVGAELLSLASPAILFASLLIIINTSLEAEGLVNIPIYSMLCGSIVKIVIGYLLIADPRFGISGAPIGTVVSYATALFVSMCFFLKRSKAKTKCISSLLPSYIFALLSVLASKAVYYPLSELIGWHLSLFLSIAVCALIYLAFSAFSGMFKNLKIALSAKYTNFA